MYKVIHDFVDKDGIFYNIGEFYPFFTIEVDEKHIEYLLSEKNKLKKPVIEEIKNETEDVEIEDGNTSDSEE